MLIGVYTNAILAPVQLKLLQYRFLGIRVLATKAHATLGANELNSRSEDVFY